MGSTSLEGHFLVAAKEMGDQNFNQSVVLIIQHNDEGAFGVILNRPTNNTVGEIWNMVAHLAADCEQPVFVNDGNET